MSLRRRYQLKFSRMLAELILYAYQQGYGIIIGEVQRSKRQAQLNANKGVGIKNSLHIISLAADIELIGADGTWLNSFEDMEFLGKKWEEMGGNWGGRFRKKNGEPGADCPHFSLSYPYEVYKGVK